MPHYAALLVAAKVTAKVHHYTVIDLVRAVSAIIFMVLSRLSFGQTSAPASPGSKAAFMSQQAVGLHVIRPPDRKIDVMLSWLPILRSIIQVDEATEE